MKTGEQIVNRDGQKHSQNVYECGCVAGYCLCGCDNAPYFIECKKHASFDAMLELLRRAEVDLGKHPAFRISALRMDIRAAILRAEQGAQGDK